MSSYELNSFFEVHQVNLGTSWVQYCSIPCKGFIFIFMMAEPLFGHARTYVRPIPSRQSILFSVILVTVSTL